MSAVQIVLFLVVICLIVSKSNDCVFIDDNTGNVLYLDALDHIEITKPDSDYIYHYTPCRNGDSCEGSGSSGMCIQTKTDADNEQICVVVARWDDRIQPTYESDDETWTFQYSNGDICYVTSLHISTITIHIICSMIIIFIL